MKISLTIGLICRIFWGSFFEKIPKHGYFFFFGKIPLNTPDLNMGMGPELVPAAHPRPIQICDPPGGFWTQKVWTWTPGHELIKLWINKLLFSRRESRGTWKVEVHSFSASEFADLSISKTCPSIDRSFLSRLDLAISVNKLQKLDSQLITNTCSS